jgi:hypothetical protein
VVKIRFGPADSGCMIARRIGALTAFASLAAMTATGITPQGTATAQTAVSPAAPSDYATEAFGDPWDWSNVEDGGPSRDLLSAGIETSRVENGQLSFTVDKPSFWFFLQGGYVDSTPTGRDANLYLVDANRFNRMVMRITSSQALSAGLLWFGCTEGDSCVGGVPINIKPGTHDYDLPLGNAILATRPWGGKISAMRLDFQPSSATQVSVDWMRLTNQASGPVGEWTGPVPSITDPDITGGDDFATLTRNGDAWDFDQSTDVLRADNATIKVEGGQVNGVNALPGMNDPSVTMKVPVAFNGSDFHRATVKWSFDGPFSLRDEPGGGMNARLVWRIAGTPPTADGQDLQESRDVVMYPTEREFTVDLATNPANAVVDPRPGKAKIGWAGQVIELFRFDPNEDPGPRSWRIDSVKLAADDAAETSFNIKLADANPAPGTTAEVFVDSDNAGYDGKLIASGVDLSSGNAVVPWTPAAGTVGTFWVYTTVKRGNFAVTRYSSGPVQMGRKTGLSAYKFGPAVGGPASQIGIADTPPVGATPPAVVAPVTTLPPATLALKPAAKPAKKAGKKAVRKPATTAAPKSARK